MPYDLSLYPADFPRLSASLKAQRQHCEACGARPGEWRPNRYGEMRPVILSVAHLDHDVWNPQARLAVLCLACHCRYDLRDRARQRRMMQIARGQLVLFAGEEAVMPPPPP